MKQAPLVGGIDLTQVHAAQAQVLQQMAGLLHGTILQVLHGQIDLGKHTDDEISHRLNRAVNLSIALLADVLPQAVESYQQVLQEGRAQRQSEAKATKPKLVVE